jgi:hypothetical protein
MSQSGQTYATHTRFLPPFHFFVLPVLIVNVFVTAWSVVQAPSASTGFTCVVALALLLGMLMSRVMAVAVQDRVIRLEMRLRLREVLPADLHERVKDLTREQFVGLRFAGDRELPDLVRRALAGELTSKKAIKLAVKDWQGDYLRA